MIDTHTHLYLFELEEKTEEKGTTVSGSSSLISEEGEAALHRALAAGVDRMIFPCVDEESLQQLLAMHRKYPQTTYTAKGLHPTSVDADWEQQLQRILDTFTAEDNVVAIGEVGIDLYWSREYRDQQIAAFEHQVILAKEEGLPVIIHCREGLAETLEALRHSGDGVPAVFHSFTGGVEDVRRIREVDDYYFGINGVVTFKNAAPLREALPEIGIDRIVLETDSPYLAPVPYRGKRNESACLPNVLAKVAEVLGLSIEETEAATIRNSERLFHLQSL
jgi:TatD DNase family protein